MDKNLQSEYQSNRYRIKPNIGTEKNRESFIGGMFLAGVSFFIGIPLCISYLWRGFDTQGIGVVLLGFCMTPVLIFQGIMGVKMVLQGISGIIQKRNWLRDATTSQVFITDRKEEFFEPSYDKDAYYIYELAFKLNTIESDEPYVWASVSKRVFRRYADKDTARIYYSPALPLNFLVEGE